MVYDVDPVFEGRWGERYESDISYRYCDRTHTLNLLDKLEKRHLLTIQCKRFLHENIDDFIRIYDKSLQINALRISGHGSHHITEVMSPSRLPALMHNIATLARHILSLEKNRFEDFSASMQSDYNLKSFYIKYINGSRFTISSEYEGHYTARIKVLGHPGIIARSTFIHQLMMYLADAINMDMAADLYTGGRKDCASKLMNFASHLTLMAYILDEHYVPAEQIHLPVSQA